MDKALEALGAWLGKADEAQAAGMASGTASIMATKCLKARPGTLAKAKENFMLMIELEQQEFVTEALLKVLGDKVPKTVAAALDVLKQAINDFGTAIDVKPVIKTIPQLFVHSNANIRDNTKSLTISLASVVGINTVKATLLEKMSDAMRKDVEAGISELPAGKHKPIRLTRREAALQGNAPGESEAEGTSEINEGIESCETMDDADHELDPYEIAEPVDILSKLDKVTVTVGEEETPFWSCFESKKWNVRKGALDKVRDLSKTPRLAPGDYNSLCRELRKILSKDANVNCAAAAADVISCLASGLRNDFSSNARQLAMPLLERFKEKNSSMSRAAADALRTLARYCFTIAEICDDLNAALGHKNPKVRLDSVNLVREMVDLGERSIVSKCRDTILPAVAKLAADADANIREASQSALVVIALKLGSFSSIESYLSQLDATRRKIIEDAVMAAAKHGDDGKSMDKRLPSHKNQNPKQGNPLSDGPTASKTMKKSNSVPLAKIESTKSRAPKTDSSTVPKYAGKRNVLTQNDARNSCMATVDSAKITGVRFSREEACEKISSIMEDSSIIEQLQSPQWQARLEAMDQLLEKVESLSSSPGASDLALCLEHVPGWTEKNFQVMNKSFEIISLLASKCSGFDYLHGSICVEGTGDRLHELKHRIQATKALDEMAECLGPRFIAAQLHSRAAANKNPKALSEALVWIANTVESFGLRTMDLPSIVQWMISDLGSSNAAVRSNAMTVLGKCHAQIGGNLMSQISDSLKPAQVTALEAVFSKHPHDVQYIATKQIRERNTSPEGVNRDRSGEQVAASNCQKQETNLEDLLPRKDISSALGDSLINKVSSPNWKERNAALDEIEALLKEAGGRITANVPTDLFPALRGRFGDTNRNLAAKSLMLLSKIADAMGEAFDKIARKEILIPALSTLNDNKKQVRDSAIHLLNSWKKTCSIEKLFVPIQESIALPKSSSEGRITLLHWINDSLNDIGAPIDVVAMQGALQAIVVSSTDKVSAVREAGLLVLKTLIVVNGKDSVARSISNLNSQSKKVFEQLLPKAFALLPASTLEEASSNASILDEKNSGSGRSQQQIEAIKSKPSLTPSTKKIPNPLTLTNQEQQPILAMSNAKNSRLRSFRGRIGKFDGLPSDETEVLSNALNNVASSEFKDLLFSLSFRDHIKAADVLAESLSCLLPEITASLDLILRWSAYRLCENNPQVSIRILEVSRAIFDALKADTYTMSDLEAHAIFPVVVDRCGQSQDRIRTLYRELLRSACSVYPSAKLLEFVTFGLTSKSSRTRLECCEFICEVVHSEGIGPVSSCKGKPMLSVASLLKERDGNLRSVALDTIAAVAMQGEPENVWKMIGKLDAKEKGMVDDRLKKNNIVADKSRFEEYNAALSAAKPDREFSERSNTPVENKKDIIGGNAFEVRNEILLQRSLDRTEETFEYHERGLTPPNALDVTPEYIDGRNKEDSHNYFSHLASSRKSLSKENIPELAGENMGTSCPSQLVYNDTRSEEASVLKTPTPSSVLKSHTPIPSNNFGVNCDLDEFEHRWSALLATMAGRSLPNAINATKEICTEIMAFTNMNESKVADESLTIVAASTERMFKIAISLLRSIFDEAEKEAGLGQSPSSRGCKYALNLMLQGMGVPEIAGSLPQGTLRECITLLLGRLVDDRGLMVFEDGPTLVRAVNVLVAKILDSANKNYSFAGLLQLLRMPPAEVPASAVTKFNDLVVKCLIKLTKGLQASGSTRDIDLSSLLFCLHDFFMFLGVDEIRRRSSADDKPLRMIKTILHELCKMEGYNIYNYTAIIPGREATPQPIIFAYIQLNLNSLVQSGAIEPKENHTGAEPSSDSRRCLNSNTEVEGLALHESLCTTSATKNIEGPEAARAVAKAEVKQRLKSIMTRLVQKEPAAQDAALKELLKLKRKYPDHVERYIAGTSELFRRFIEEGMARFEDISEEEIDFGNDIAYSPASVMSDTSQQSSRSLSLRERLQSLHDSAEKLPRSQLLRSPLESSSFNSGQKTSVYRGEMSEKQSIDELAARLRRLKSESK